LGNQSEINLKFSNWKKSIYRSISILKHPSFWSKLF